MRWAWLIGLGSLLTSCTVGPNYQRPYCTCNHSFDDLGEHPEIKPGLEVEVEWWKSFGDPMLVTLIQRSLRGNLTVQEAAARVASARAQWRITYSLLSPAFTPVGLIQRERDSQNSGFGSTFDTINFELDATWDPDLFGRNRRRVEAETALLSATVDQYRDVLLNLIAEVASAYISLRQLQQQLAVTEENVGIQTTAVEITQARYEAGIVGQLDVAQSRRVRSSTESAVPILNGGIANTLNSISVLVGGCPPALDKWLLTESALPALPHEINLGMPWQVVLRRPDLQAAERQLAAATAQIGVAMADLFPTISLSGAIGLNSRHLGNLFNQKSLFWNIAANLLGPIIQGNRLQANVDLAVAQRLEAFLNFKQQILQAFQEVRDAVANFEAQQLSAQFLDDAIHYANHNLTLANDLYSTGLTDFLNVLDAQTAQVEIANGLVATRAGALLAAVNLYQALGGGWEAVCNGQVFQTEP